MVLEGLKPFGAAMEPQPSSQERVQLTARVCARAQPASRLWTIWVHVLELLGSESSFDDIGFGALGVDALVCCRLPTSASQPIGQISEN